MVGKSPSFLAVWLDKSPSEIIRKVTDEIINHITCCFLDIWSWVHPWRNITWYFILYLLLYCFVTYFTVSVFCLGYFHTLFNICRFNPNIYEYITRFIWSVISSLLLLNYNFVIVQSFRAVSLLQLKRVSFINGYIIMRKQVFGFMLHPENDWNNFQFRNTL